jgi:putative aldouronate transport system permease protein
MKTGGVDMQKAERVINYKKRRSFQEFLYILPFLLLVAVFSYFPLYGWIYAFHDFVPPKPISSETFVGFKWFASLFSNPVKSADVLRVMRNTLAMSGISLLFSWFPMIFAVFLNEIRCKPYRKFVQTATTLPNFISWVLVFAVAFSIFGTNGAVNSVLQRLGVITEPISFLKSADHVWFRMWLWLTWKNAGWAAIMYLAAISAIDEQMIEAAKVDGATRMQIIWHITIPSILPTYFVIVMLNIASFLSNGMEQYYVFQNAFNRDWIEVLDLYVYNYATAGRGNYPLATAISILKSIVSLFLLTGANGLSKLIRGESFI